MLPHSMLPPCHPATLPPLHPAPRTCVIPKLFQEALLVLDGVAARLLDRQRHQAAHHPQRQVALRQQQQHLRQADGQAWSCDWQTDTVE